MALIESILNTEIIVSIIIFFLGFAINALIQKWNKCEELSQCKFSIEEWSEKSASTLTDYINSLQDFSIRLKNNKELAIPSWRSNIVHITRVNGFSIEQLYSIYLFGVGKSNMDKNRKILMNFLYKLDYIEKAQDLIMEVYKEYRGVIKNIIDDWNLYYFQLIDFFPKYYNPNSPFEETKSKVWGMLQPLIKERDDCLKIDVDKWTDNFINPAFSEIFKSEYKNSEEMQNLIKIIRGLRVTIIQYNNTHNYHHVFDDYANNLNASQKGINEFINHFKTKDIILLGIKKFKYQTTMDKEMGTKKRKTSDFAFTRNVFSNYTSGWLCFANLIFALVCVYSVCNLCPRDAMTKELEFDYMGVIVAILALLITFMAAWNIWSTINAKQEILELKEYKHKIDEELKNTSAKLYEQWSLDIYAILPLLYSERGTVDYSGIKEALELFYKEEGESISKKFSEHFVVLRIYQILHPQNNVGDKADIYNPSWADMLSGHLSTMENDKPLHRFISHIDSYDEEYAKRHHLDEVKDVLNIALWKMYRKSIIEENQNKN